MSSNGTTLIFGPADASFTGNDVFTYTISDPQGGEATAIITLQNALPIASDEVVHPGTGLVMLDVLHLGTEDLDPDGDTLTITAVTNGQHGTTSTDGVTVTYTPGAGYDGNDVFSYAITDGRASATATISLRNAAPIATNDLVHPGSGVFTLDVLHLATAGMDPDGDALTIVAVTSGTVGTTSSDGSTITYTPGSGYDGNDSFSYTISDGRGATDTATVRLRNTVPTVAADVIITDGEPVTFNPRLNDSDADNDAFLVIAVTQGGSGAVTDDGSTITYTPGSRFFGRDAFTYTVSDATGSSTTTVRVRSSKPIALDGLTKGGQVVGQPEGIVYDSFGASANEVFTGTIRGQTGPAKRAVFSKDGAVLLTVGNDAPGLSGATIGGVGEPSGNALIVSLRGSGVSPANKRALHPRLGGRRAAYRDPRRRSPEGRAEGEALPHDRW